MNFYTATLVELLIIELFVFGIWLKVLVESVRAQDSSMASQKLIITSVGLVLSSLAVAGIMGYRIYEAYVDAASAWTIVAFYAILAASGFLFIISAAIGESAKLIKWFVGATAGWTATAFFINYFYGG